MTIIASGRRFDLNKYGVEKDFEEDIRDSSSVLFGKATIYIDAKKKIESKTLGATVPDGFFFDFKDPTDPQFYIVEVELSRHGFYDHIFPQITKFFAFFKNTGLQKRLVDKLFSVVDSDPQLKSEFRKYIGHTEIYKFLSDIIETSQNILLVTDGGIAELPEIMATYTDTWGKMVKCLEVRKYMSGNDVAYSVSPDVETLQYAETEEAPNDEGSGEQGPYSEQFHLEDVPQSIRDVYAKIKQAATLIDGSVIFNPQKYYISIKAPTNVAFLKIRKKKVRFIAMLPEVRIRDLIKIHAVASLSQPVQDFYNGPCAAIDIPDAANFAEIETLLRDLLAHKPAGS
ncbi:MAG TPA: hypothetical protein VKV57_14900 [bacterium]|nr:hypothetical protein [bacterium]